jgi:nitrogen fixation protein FixH
MKKLILFLVLFIAATTVCSVEAFQLSGQTGGYKVVMNFTEPHAIKGNNTVEIVVTDAKSLPVKGAKVTVEYFMPSLPRKKPMMDYVTATEPDGGIYRTTLDLNMKGEWKATVTIEKGKEKRTVTIPFEVK